MKDKLISYDDIRKIHPIFRGKHGDKFINLIMKVSGLNHVNEIYDRSKHLTGPAFCKDVLDKLEIIRIWKNIEVLDKYKDKPFITVSNHAYGHIDGIAAIELVGSRVNDYKMMVNFVLGMIDTMSENFIVVNPFKSDKNRDVTLNGIKECIDHIRQGHHLGFFPAGAISDFTRKGLKITIADRKWQPSVVKLIKKARVPVIPMHFSGGNSPRFYALRLFGWQIRTLGLCHELKNKKGKELVITIGDPIMPAEISKYRDMEELGEFLKSRTYALGNVK
ncbi:MAG TPA: 1-acyl-sn-glycerol-3-phosphate acyltransferase [Dysgonamonadaceae bacterium]|jgi:putative hemolysin|nr:1-acyl-sn-glycerol-3-phosphate acyltransferase [Dysgonamonadaceae bacterium]